MSPKVKLNRVPGNGQTEGQVVGGLQGRDPQEAETPKQQGLSGAKEPRVLLSTLASVISSIAHLSSHACPSLLHSLSVGVGERLVPSQTPRQETIPPPLMNGTATLLDASGILPYLILTAAPLRRLCIPRIIEARV